MENWTHGSPCEVGMRRWRVGLFHGAQSDASGDGARLSARRLERRRRAHVPSHPSITHERQP